VVVVVAVVVSSSSSSSSSSSTSSSSSSSSSQQDTTNVVDQSQVWSGEQQKALEQALARYPSSIGVERWDKIATDVPGKTKKECVARFKYLAEMLKAQKAGKK